LCGELDIKLKSKINELIFGSVTRELLFFILSLITILVAADVIKDIGLYGMSWFIDTAMRNIVYGFESGFIPLIVIILLISFSNRIN